MSTTHQILIGFDFGMKRIGMAIGQMITKTARPLQTIVANQGNPDWKALKKIVNSWQPDGLVVGIPFNMDGTPQLTTHAAKHFASLLKETFQLPVYEVDERLTTKAAREQVFQGGGYKALQNRQIDSIAAQLILENWLNQH